MARKAVTGEACRLSGQESKEIPQIASKRETIVKRA
jgi:hypothetical protein